MPKRKLQDEIKHYKNKIKQLKLKELSEKHKRRRIISDSSDSDEQENEAAVAPELTVPQPEIPEPDIPESEIPELNADVLNALGQSLEDSPRLGPKIHENLARLWVPIICKGLNKESKEKLLKEYIPPENFSLLQAPKMNPEILAVISDVSIARDKRVSSIQTQLGAAITALNRGLELLLESTADRLKAVKHLSESCRLLCDIHYTETEARRRFITPGLDKSFNNIVQEIERDELLFGTKLSEKIKASKAIEKQGQQIKKPNPLPVRTNQSAMNRPRPQLNWTGPPRYQSTNRGGRGGPRKPAPPGRRLTMMTSAQPRASGPPKQQRAPPQRQ